MNYNSKGMARIGMQNLQWKLDTRKLTKNEGVCLSLFHIMEITIQITKLPNLSAKL
jgi:hypothetical protein